MAINPFQAPINYAVDVQSPFQAALGGIQLGSGLADIDAARQKRQLEANALQQAQQRQTDLANLYKNPNATSADYARIAAFLPKDQAAIVTQGFERLTKEQQQSDLRMGGEVYSAIKSGNLDVAKRRLTEKAAALRNSGRENEAKAAEDSLELINLNPTGAQATIGLYMARLPGGKDFLDNADKALSTLRLEQLQPSVLKKSVADADEAVAKAAQKVLEAADTRSRLEAEQNLRLAQTAQQEALTAGSVGVEARAKEQAPSALIAAKAKADKGVADAITAQNTATNSAEKAAADAKRATAEAEKARIETQFKEQEIKLGFRKTEQDIIIAKENARIAALNAAQAKETNVLRRQELQQKIDEATDKKSQATRDQKSLLDSQVGDIDNFINTAIRATNTPLNVRKNATGPVTSRLPTVSQDVSDYESLIETLGSQAFLAQIPKIRGTGALSENEGNKLQASLQNLSTKQSAERLQENINEAVRLLTKARENIVIRSGMSAPPVDTPAATQVRLTLADGRVAVFANQAEADAAKRAGVKFK